MLKSLICHFAETVLATNENYKGLMKLLKLGETAIPSIILSHFKYS